jgi:peroxiredoxin
MKAKLYLPLTVLLLSLVSGIGFIIFSQELTKVPDISLNFIDGRKVDFETFRGKPLLVTFWSTTCSTCIKEMPHLVELYNELNKEGFEIIAIAMPYDPPNMVVELSEKKGITYPIALDIEGLAMKAFGDVSLTPTSFLIDSLGNIVEQKTGEIDIKQLRTRIKELLKTSKATIS